MALLVLFCLIGFLILYYGAEWLVKGSSSLARSLGMAPVVIGLTVVAFGTSAPELVVSLISSIQGKSMIAVGNVVESSPAIGADGTIYVGSYDHKLCAINPDGTEKWSFDTGNYVHSSVAIAAALSPNVSTEITTILLRIFTFFAPYVELIYKLLLT